MAELQEKVFDLLGLPLELRDMIYDLLLREKSCFDGKRKDFVECRTTVPVTNMRLVSKQIRDEYDKRWKQKIHLDFFDNTEHCYEDEIKLPPLTEPYIRTADFHLFGDYLCGYLSAEEREERGARGCDDASFHRNWLEVFIPRLQALQSATIKLHLDPEDNIWNAKDFALLMKGAKQLLSIPKVERVEIYYTERVNAYADCFKSPDKSILVARTTTTGPEVLVDVAEIKKRLLPWSKSMSGEAGYGTLQILSDFGETT